MRSEIVLAVLAVLTALAVLAVLTALAVLAVLTALAVLASLEGRWSRLAVTGRKFGGELGQDSTWSFHSPIPEGSRWT
ncbi:hypothetical protein [Natronosalvus rutilus]|uniref:Uncharacterized protein n=1 Tax=Natronosalvus rutilus TaxID=2953753 RepID=A0A9E7NAG1_9EURY|nr:hypothetical protein [Natronosalvus rutilus]UTF53806.1 hypothetical protein NGM29_00540 [Natronosalvus rutilus]